MTNLLRTGVALVALIAVGFSVETAGAAPGDLDPSFSHDGKVTLYGDDYETLEPDFSDAALQPNGRIVVSGNDGLHRIKPNGTDDASFSGGSDSALAAIAIEPTGKIDAAGYSYENYDYDPDSDFAVFRYHADGTPARGFGEDGRVVTSLGVRGDQAEAVAVQPDGKILVAGYSTQLDSEDVASRDFATARYNPDGSLDPTFAGDGTRITDLGGDDIARDVTVQPNGKIVVAGSSSGDLAVVRYTPYGTPDPSFSGDGKARAGFTDPDAPGGQTVAAQPNGRIMVAGGENDEFALARFDPNGSLDRSFSRDGIVTTGGFTPSSTYPFLTEANDVVLQGDRILAAGTATGDFAVARYRSDGSLDPSFSHDGILTTDFNEDGDSATAIVPQPNTVLVAGSSQYFGGKYGYFDDGALARYRLDAGPADGDADGVLDSSDGCPNVYQPNEADGCPVYARTLTLRLVERRHSAHLKATLGARDTRCLDGAQVTVYRVRRGRTKGFSATWVQQAGRGKTRVYDAQVPKQAGRFYATTPTQVVPTFGRCGSARSNTVALGR